MPVQVGVTCIPDDEEAFEGAAKDLSLGGMFIESERRPVFGTRLTLVLLGVATRELRLPAVVRWSEPRGFGVQFGLLGAYATHAVLKLVKKSSS